ncbi:hypothetical protein HID58_092208 [Brassica napus]|uniref:Uncharacterized protein n=1 Tax=Brassica napus TaxID=3708 RepID=A0ABQ7WZI1_BRANA|nr:hypothetical protein HID58_092208 [Brassica napus]
MRPVCHLQLIDAVTFHRPRLRFHIQGRAINKCFGAMKICTIEISHSLSNPTDAFRYVVFLCSSRQFERRPLLKHGVGASSEVLGT